MRTQYFLKSDIFYLAKLFCEFSNANFFEENLSISDEIFHDFINWVPSKICKIKLIMFFGSRFPILLSIGGIKRLHCMER